VEQGNAAAAAATAARVEIFNGTADVRKKVGEINKQVEAGAKLAPQLASMQEQLERQQKVLSSSGEFVRSVFSSHQVDFFTPDQAATPRYRILPRVSGQGASVYLLLGKQPIRETLELKYHIFSQPENSYFSVKNLVIFSWGDAAESVKTHQISLSYFPNLSEKDLIKGLSEKDGRVYADGEPLPRIGEPDPAFKGNRWIPPPK
jgi:hypothetical protein